MSGQWLVRRPYSQQLLNFVDAATSAVQVDYGVAVRTNRAEVGYRIDFVFLADVGKWSDMMNMNEALSEWAVYLTEVQPTYHAD
jgi:hypothetical protein